MTRDTMPPWSRIRKSLAILAFRCHTVKRRFPSGFRGPGVAREGEEARSLKSPLGGLAREGVRTDPGIADRLRAMRYLR